MLFMDLLCCGILALGKGGFGDMILVFKVDVKFCCFLVRVFFVGLLEVLLLSVHVFCVGLGLW